MKLLILCRYGNLGASSRVRFYQYLWMFKSRGWAIKVSPLFSNAYLECSYTAKPRVKHIIQGYLSRLVTLTKVHHFDLLIIEKELFPYLPGWFEQFLSWCKVRYVVDYDDATFHSYDQSPTYLVRFLLGKKIDQVMRRATLVTAGNEYIAHRARTAGAKNVDVIPTVVDTERYTPTQNPAQHIPIVGWIGTPKTAYYLNVLLPVFGMLSSEMRVRFVAVGANQDDFDGTTIEVWPWSEESEVQLIQQFDIGIMPLTDSPWERGKCGYKLIQYMASEKPVVASPVGVNSQIVDHGIVGYLASSPEEWRQYLMALLRDAALRSKMGKSGRERVVNSYSLQVQAPRFVNAIEQVKRI